MAISNVDLRKQMFGADRQPVEEPKPDAPKSRTGVFPLAVPAPRKPHIAIAPLAAIRKLFPSARPRLGNFPAWTAKEEPPRLDRSAIAARLLAAATAKTRFEPNGRLDFADAGKGLAIILVMLIAVLQTGAAMPAGFGWLAAAGAFAEPFALPAFFVFAGLFLKRSRENEWDSYFATKIAPVALAAMCWIMAATFAAVAQAGPDRPEGLLSKLALVGSYLHLAVILFLLPLFMFAWKALGRFRTGTIFVCAALMEILHTSQGGALWVEGMRCAVYFAAGHCLARNFRALAQFTRANPVPAGAIAAAIASFNALLVFADLPLAYGQKISTLPFASLALGLAGAASVVIAGELIAATRFGPLFCALGRRWIIVYATAPLAFVLSAGLLAQMGLFGTQALAIAALLVAAAAAAAAMLVMELREPAGERETARI